MEPDSAEGAELRAAWVARTSYGRLLALLAARTGDIAAAEDALADAFERALMSWPENGVPENPEAWLLTVARNRLRDASKSAANRTSVPLDPGRHTPVEITEIDPDAIGERRLELMLVCAHPAIDAGIRTPLMLNTVLAYTAAQIATALTLPSPTVAARLVRAKRKIKAAGIEFDIPDRTVLPERMDHLLEAVYGAYAIDWELGGTQERDSLGHEALYLAELVATLAPAAAEAHGLAALISLSAARAPARLDGDGHPTAPWQQRTALWDRWLIERGRGHLRAAHAIGEIGRYQLEAAIQATHCARLETGTTDWASLRELYKHLNRLAPTLGSATALAAVTAETSGAEEALAILDGLGEQAQRFQPAWATRAHLLELLGRDSEAVTAYERAISLSTDPAERAYLVRNHRLLTCAGDPTP